MKKLFENVGGNTFKLVKEYHDEDFGDGYTNDYQRAFANSQSTYQEHDDTKKAEELAKQGKYVVMVVQDAHCKVTDAVLGQHTSIDSIFDNNEDAQKKERELSSYSDGAYIISPETLEAKNKPQIKSEPASEDSDDVPFE